MKKYDLVGGLFWSVLGIGICIESIHLKLGELHRPGPGFTPFLAGVLLTILGSMLVFPSISTRLRKNDGLSGKKLWVKENRKIFIITILTLVGYISLLEFLGFVVTTFIFFLILFKLKEPKRWVKPIVFSAVTVMISYLIFSVWLTCPFPKGIFKF